MASGIAWRVYDVYGRFYDVFEMLFKRRLGRAIRSVPFHTGDRVLDVGIGTGLSLEYYPSYVQVTGIDLSQGMLRQAQRKVDMGLVRADCRRSDTELRQANALDLPFGDQSFDVVLLSHVITTVPDPHRCLREALRVVRERGYVVLVNHFRSEYPGLNWMETAIDPICRKLGWRCDLSLAELLGGRVENPSEMRKSRGVIFRIVYLRKIGGAVRIVALPEGAGATLRPAVERGY